MESSNVNGPAVHRIRLKGPWEIQQPDAESGQFEQFSMPMDWRQLFGDVAGTASFRRNFHLPSGLTPQDRVLIHIPNGTGELTDFSVNTNSIKPCSNDPLKFDVTDHLIDFNRIQFSLSFDPLAQNDLPGGLWETVFIEIHSGQ